MVPIMSLWIPILLSAVLVFFASFLFHMVLPFHRKDYKKVPDEDAFLDAVRRVNIPHGDYVVPCASGPQGMKDPAFVEKWKKGPLVIMTVAPGGIGMGGQLAQWFFYCVLVGFFAAYIAGRALEPGSDYLAVFRFAGASAFAGYALAHMQNSIWMKRSWGATLRAMFDGLVYGALTGGVFGWLWPR